MQYIAVSLWCRRCEKFLCLLLLYAVTDGAS